MPWESIGSTDTGNMPDDETWILFSLKLAKKYIEFVCGSPPPGSTLDIMPNYSELGVFYEYFEPSEYIRACELTLYVMNNAVSWYDLKKHFEKTWLENNEIEVSAED